MFPLQLYRCDPILNLEIFYLDFSFEIFYLDALYVQRMPAAAVRTSSSEHKEQAPTAQ
jgi:hypothetical protein